MKNSNDTIGNRARDLPTCNAVPQPSAPPRARVLVVWKAPDYNQDCAFTKVFSVLAGGLKVVPSRNCTASGSRSLWDREGNKFGWMDFWA